MKKAISKIKGHKAALPSGIVVEIFTASGETGIDLIMELANSIANEDVVPAYWKDSSIVNSYNGKGDALERGNYRGLSV